MAMDRAEKLGLGAAIGGHAVLLGAMVLGLFISSDRLTKPEAISVSLVGEIADVSTAPDAIQEESAPPAPAEAEPVERTPTPVMKVERDQPKAVERPVKRDVPPPPAKTATKKIVQKEPPAKTAKAAAPGSPGFSKSFEDAVNAAGKAPGAGKAVGTPAAKTAAEVRRSVSVSLAGQIRSRVRACAPSGVDINKIETFVTLSLDSSGNLNSVRFDKQVGVNESNQPQAGPLKDCILQAVRAASPYEGLDSDYYDVWKSHALRLRATG
jgi:hypothetical protein